MASSVSGNAGDFFDAGEGGVAEAVGFNRGINRFVLAAFGEIHAAVFFIHVINGDPGAAEGVGVGGNVVGVLMPALAGLAGGFGEEHGLEGEDVGADEDFEDVDDARVEEEAFVDGEVAVEHVDAEPEFGFFLGGEIFGRALEFLDVGAGVRVDDVGCHGFALFGEAALHEVVGVLAEFVDVGGDDEAGDDEEAVAAEGDVLVDGEDVLVGSGDESKRLLGEVGDDCGTGGGHGHARLLGREVVKSLNRQVVYFHWKYCGIRLLNGEA